jgi:glc operon protein GlcG
LRLVRFRSARPGPRRAFAANPACSGHSYTGTLDPTLVASPGGFPLVEGGKLIGAVGCSGGTGDQDAAVCKVGAEVVK